MVFMVARNPSGNKDDYSRVERVKEDGMRNSLLLKTKPVARGSGGGGGSDRKLTCSRRAFRAFNYDY